MTSKTATQKTSLSRWITDSVLDLDYGDEQERMRYYEMYAMIINVQLVLIPIVAAVAILGYGATATGPIVVMFAATYAPMLLGIGYLNRYGVRTNTIAFSKKNRSFNSAYLLGCLALGVAVLIVNRADSYVNLGWVFVLSAAISMLVILAFSARRARDEQAQS